MYLTHIKPRQEALLNHTTSRTSDAHVMTAIMGEVDFDPLSHN